MKKECFKCHKIKDVNCFYVHGQMSDGHLGKCKSCAKKDVHDRYSNPESRKRIVEYERKRYQNPERKKKALVYQQRRRLKFKGKNKARRLAYKALREGRLKRLPCEICGNIKSQAHHEDYRKYLNVKWLCFKHHRELHNQIVSD